MANKKDVSFFTPENELQKKTGIGGLPESVIGSAQALGERIEFRSLREIPYKIQRPQRSNRRMDSWLDFKQPPPLVFALNILQYHFHMAWMIVRHDPYMPTIQKQMHDVRFPEDSFS